MFAGSSAHCWMIRRTPTRGRRSKSWRRATSSVGPATRGARCSPRRAVGCTTAARPRRSWRCCPSSPRWPRRADARRAAAGEGALPGGGAARRQDGPRHAGVRPVERRRRRGDGDARPAQHQEGPVEGHHRRVQEERRGSVGRARGHRLAPRERRRPWCSSTSPRAGRRSRTPSSSRPSPSTPATSARRSSTSACSAAAAAGGTTSRRSSSAPPRPSSPSAAPRSTCSSARPAPTPRGATTSPQRRESIGASSCSIRATALPGASSWRSSPSASAGTTWQISTRPRSARAPRTARTSGFSCRRA